MSTSYGDPAGDRVGRDDGGLQGRLDDTAPGPVAADGTSSAGSQAVEDRKTVVAREKEQFGGVKIGSAFFGWLTAVGVAVLLTTLLASAGTALGLSAVDNLGQAADAAGDNAETIGIAGGIGLLVILFLAYFCGGYVAGRMARFNGLKQGVAVWVWGIVITVAVALLGALAGEKYDVLAKLNLPRIPINEGDATTAGIVALVAVAIASLVGAMLGGLTGMRFHRNVDKAGLGR